MDLPTQESWEDGGRPNYNTNVDLMYPYSEIPYVGDFHLVKLPDEETIIKHVDYWGEGDIKDCYNINHQYQLVTTGPNLKKKIPNRIPVEDYDKCDTTPYITENSVHTVTASILGSAINKSCATDIAKMINKETGIIVLYGFETNAEAFTNVKEEVKQKNMFYCPHYGLTDDLVTYGRVTFDTYVVFLNYNEMKDLINHNIHEGEYEKAVDQTKQLGANVMKNFIDELLVNKTKNLMSFAYKLWESDAKDIIGNYFPRPFQLIFGQEIVRIIDRLYHQAIKLDSKTDPYNDRLAWADSDRNVNRAGWHTCPVWENNQVIFKLRNDVYDMYLKLDVNVDTYGNRRAWGSADSNEKRFKFYLEPLFNEHDVAFFVVNYEYEQSLTLEVNPDLSGDRAIAGFRGDARTWGKEDLDRSKRFRWNIVD